MSDQLFRKEDFITMAELREQLTKDANYGVYIINSARIAVNQAEYAELDLNSPFADNTIDATININIGTIKEPNLVAVAPTWIPISLADYGEPLEIFKSQGFKSMHERGYVALISKEAYDRIMSDEGAREARQHMLNEKYSASASQSNDQLLSQLNKNASRRTTKSDDKAPKAKAARNVLSNAAHEFTDKGSDAPHTALFSKYKALEPKLSVFDLEHISKHTVVPKIKAASEKRLAVLNKA